VAESLSRPKLTQLPVNSIRIKPQVVDARYALPQTRSITLLYPVCRNHAAQIVPALLTVVPNPAFRTRNRLHLPAHPTSRPFKTFNTNNSLRDPLLRLVHCRRQTLLRRSTTQAPRLRGNQALRLQTSTLERSLKLGLETAFAFRSGPGMLSEYFEQSRDSQLLTSLEQQYTSKQRQDRINKHRQDPASHARYHRTSGTRQRFILDLRTNNARHNE
jgi:hypothetical protein